MNELASWVNDIISPDIDRGEQLRSEKRREILESLQSPLTAETKEELIRAGPGYYALLVERDRWEANAGEYGAEGEILHLCRLADVGELLARESVSNALLTAHRDRHLSADNRRLIGYTDQLVDNEHYVVIFDGRLYNSAGTAMRGPFYKTVFGYAAFEIKRNSDSGTFVMPSFSAIEAQIAKTRPRTNEQPLAGREIRSGVVKERIDPPRQFTAHARTVAAKAAQNPTKWEDEFKALESPALVAAAPPTAASLRLLAQKLAADRRPPEIDSSQ